jgi:transcriptional regulator with XRE-family HTH domain
MKIDPAILKSKREQLGWSQQALSDKSKVSKRQIQRLEHAPNGSPDTSVHELTVHRIAKALGVAPDQLNGDLQLPASPAGRSKGLEEALTQRLDSRTILNFDLLTVKYGVTMEEVILAAPMLFGMFAEKCARLHRDRLVERLMKGDEEIEIEDIPAEKWEVRSDEHLVTSVVCREEIFALQQDPFGTDNAFVDTLREELSKLDNPPVQLIDISEGRGFLEMHPGNRIPATNILSAELSRVTCLDPESYWTLLWGGARLTEIPNELLMADRAIDRIKWLRERSPTKKAALGDTP